MAAFKSTILITGGTSGLGYECAVDVARSHPDCYVIIASRSDPDNVAEKINRALGQENVAFCPLDLASLANVRSFSESWQQHHGSSQQPPPIRALVLNAALQFPDGVSYSVDGLEQTFAISHVGHALLLFLLRPHFADDARVVIVASGTHDPEQKTGMPEARYNSAEELAHPTPESAKASGRQRYTSTKLSNVLFTYALQRRFEAANQHHGKLWTVTAIDPGLMFGTGLARNASSVVRFLSNHILIRTVPLMRLLLFSNIHTPEESGRALARLAVGSEVQGQSGLYFEGLKEIKSSKVSYDTGKQEDLWQWTVNFLAKADEEKALFGFADLA